MRSAMHAVVHIPPSGPRTPAVPPSYLPDPSNFQSLTGLEDMKLESVNHYASVRCVFDGRGRGRVLLTNRRDQVRVTFTFASPSIPQTARHHALPPSKTPPYPLRTCGLASSPFAVSSLERSPRRRPVDPASHSTHNACTIDDPPHTPLDSAAPARPLASLWRSRLSTLTAPQRYVFRSAKSYCATKINSRQWGGEGSSAANLSFAQSSVHRREGAFRLLSTEVCVLTSYF